MSLSSSIPHAIGNVVTGIAVATIIELILPPPSASDSTSQLGFEVALQAALNGLAIAAVVPVLDPSRDPTFGIPFYAALLSCQTTFSTRLERSGAVVKYHASQSAQQMGLPALGVGRPTADPLQS